MFLKTNKWLAQGLLKNSAQGRAEADQSCVETESELSTPEQYSAPSQLIAVISQLLWLPPGSKHLEDSLPVSSLFSRERENMHPPHFKIKTLERKLMIVQGIASTVSQHSPRQVPRRIFQALHYVKCYKPSITVYYRERSRFHGL